MASEDAGEKDLTEPELEYIDESEIAATIDLSAIGLDGIARPVFINQCDEDSLALTLDDAERLNKFLTEAIVYLKAYQVRITQ